MWRRLKALWAYQGPQGSLDAIRRLLELAEKEQA